MTQIAGRNAIVTGGASGIGLGIATKLLAAGARVAISDIDVDAVTAVAADIGAFPIGADVSNIDDVRNMADAVVDEFGSIDIVVNNAGVGPFARIADLSIEDWQWMIGVNLFGVIHGVNVFLPLLEQNAEGGHIVNTSSMAAFTPLERLGSYAVTKFGVAALTEVLQAELATAGSKVHATLLAPGSVQTNIARSTRHRPHATGSRLEDAQIGLEFSGSSRWLTPDDVGTITLRAIENNDAYAITHPDRWPQVAARFARIEEAFTKYPPLP